MMINCAGWHTQLNNKARRGRLDLYQLVSLLHVEADFVTLQVKLVSERRLRRYQRKAHSSLQGRLSKLWDDFDRGDINSHQLLRACVGICAPI